MTGRHEALEPDDRIGRAGEDAAVAQEADGLDGHGGADASRGDPVAVATPEGAAEDVVEDEPQERTERRSDVVIVTLVFVVLFGYDLLEGIQQLRDAPAFYRAFDLGEPPWPLIVAAVVAPPVLFAAGMLVARGQRLVARAGVLLVALGVSAQVALLVEAWAAALLPV